MDEWLDGAREDLNAELEYIYDEFGVKSAESAYLKEKESIDNLCHFPHLGKRFCNMVYHGQEVRSLSMKHTSVIYCRQGEKILIIALWNNRRDEKTLKTMVESR
ncbi:MAG: type II toxin-antitoxin system RelE/ParE family toxin [Bacteroidales bacterium]|nr:type II toxin-antitoxin system RelE/ParE family toxin [Bacteroidales bacterium]